MKALTAVGALALMAFASPAYAWTGCYVGAQGGYAASVTDLAYAETVNYPAESEYSAYNGVYNIASLNGLGADGPAFGGVVGCDYRLGKFVIGAFADYLRHNDHEISFTLGEGEESLKASVELESQWSAGGRVGYLVNDDTLFYALAAYTKGQTGDLKISLGDESGALSLQDQTGYSLGAGLETRLSGNLYLAGEYRYTQFDKNTYNLDGGDYWSEDISSETTVHTGLISLKLKFGPADPVVAAPLK